MLMASKTITIDDLDGSEGAKTVYFAYNNVSFEIDLSDKNIEKLEKLLTPYISAARQQEGMHVTTSLPRTRRRRAIGEQTVTTKIDYTDPDRFGQLHRGRITEKEAALVRENLDAANAHRAAAGQSPIDPNDPKEKQRYGL